MTFYKVVLVTVTELSSEVTYEKHFGTLREARQYITEHRDGDIVPLLIKVSESRISVA